MDNRVTFVAFLLIFYPLTQAHDIILSLNETGLQKLVDPFTSLIDDFILQAYMPAQTIRGTVNTDILNDATLFNISHNPITLTLDPISQQIHVSITNIDLLFNTIQFEAWKKIFFRISCFGTISPEIYDYNLSFSVNIVPNDVCAFNVSLNESSIIITQSQSKFNTILTDGACQTIFDISDVLLDIETSLWEQVLDAIPALINTQIEAISESLIEQSSVIPVFNEPKIHVCYKDIEIGASYIEITADFIVDETNTIIDDSNSFGFDYYNAFNENQEDSTLLYAIIIWTLIVLFVGVCIGLCLMHCIQKIRNRKAYKATEACATEANEGCEDVNTSSAEKVPSKNNFSIYCE